MLDANDAEERSGPRCGDRRRRLGRPAAARAGRHLPAAARAAAERLVARVADPRLGGARPRRRRGGLAGGAYLYVHESVAAVAPEVVDVKKALKELDVPLPGQPATALVIGYDRRASDAKNAPSRSDTLMLVRADPDGEDDLDALVPARPPGRDPLPRPEPVDGQDQRRLLGLRRQRARSRPCGS